MNEGDSCSYLKNMTILSSICQHTYLNWYRYALSDDAAIILEAF